MSSDKNTNKYVHNCTFASGADPLTLGLLVCHTVSISRDIAWKVANQAAKTYPAMDYIPMKTVICLLCYVLHYCRITSMGSSVEY